MESPRERACPNCGAAAAAPQRWCLECGHELSGARRTGLRSAVGIATTLAVLVGAASAGGYTILQDDKVPPPPATTVAQAPSTTAPAETLPPATQEPAPYSYTPPATLPDTPTSNFGRGPRAPVVPLDGPRSGSNGGGSVSRGSPGTGSVEPETHTTTTPTAPAPQFAVTDIALGAAAVAYAPYAAPDADLGDPSRAVDGSTRTAWKAPAAADPAAPPQLGLYVDLASREKLRSLKLQTPTPGMNIEIYGAKSGPPASITDAGWDHLADRSGIAAQTKVKLGDRPYRYLLVWIVGAPPDGARPSISELSLLSLQPE
ncbi:MAG TPA: hypothetical protein VFS37_08505 [Conexibacter sp.]|nr:hypothetical protein [Conexibacter sp.]